MKYTIPDCGKGLNLDTPPSELAPGVWSGGSNFRFTGGLAEMWEGAGLYYSSGANVPLWGMPAVLDDRIALYVTGTKAYTRNATTTSEVTRYTDGAVVTSATAVGTTVTITTATPHGLTTGNPINAYGFVPTTYNTAAAQNCTVTSPTTFTYPVLSAPGVTPATVNGAYSGNLTSNFSSSTSGSGYTGGPFAGLVLFNHPTDGLYYLSSSTSILRRVPSFTDANGYATCVAARPFKNFIVVLGMSSQRQAVNWSHAVSDTGSPPTSFAPSDTTLAGGVFLAETVGNAMDCLPLGDANIIYMTDARYAMQYLEGSTSVMSFTRLPGSSGLLTQNCVVSTPFGHVYLTPDFDVLVHSGGEAKSIASNRVKAHLRSSISANTTLCFLAVNPAKSEVWICYPTTSTTGCDKALVWNWIDDTWGKFDLNGTATAASGVTFAVAGIWPGVDQNALGMFGYHSTDSTKTGIYYSVNGAGSMFGSALTGTLIREGMDIEDRDRMKTLQRSRWNLDATAGNTVTIEHGSSKFADTAATYQTGVTYTIGTNDYANARATQGRFLAIKLTTGTVATNARVRSIDLDVTPGGLR
jgi:hypothetical protein